MSLILNTDFSNRLLTRETALSPKLVLHCLWVFTIFFLKVRQVAIISLSMCVFSGELAVSRTPGVQR